MDRTPPVPRSLRDRLLLPTAAGLLGGALLFAAVFAWHAVLAGTTAGTFIVVSAWVAGLFGLASAFVVATVVLARRTDPPGTRWPVAVWLVAAAWLVVGLVWAAAGLQASPLFAR